MAVDLSKMLEKRREVLGKDDKFLAKFDDTEFWIVAQELAPRSHRERLAEIQADVEDEVLTPFEGEDAVIEQYLGDQSDDFRTMCDEANVDPFEALNMALSEHNKEVRRNPTQRSSRNTRRR
ncbi:MAG: hypothetical protein L0K30_00370 [Acidipropionibacterium jensenii]|uniref:hypothetical protein n=1 Tax=Acidipropionibacterium jensenii TaxID=1749 RepID=UPI0026478F2A|nr:hypothetical protein [Acidipropionibacterium jensenii]MDN6440486.1 hypothetical protein [Acidipropionibacterium jensenii]